VYKVLGDPVSRAGCTPVSVRASEKWVRTVDTTKNHKESFEKILMRRSLYSAVYRTYTVTLKELKAILQVIATKKNSSQKATTATPRIESSPMEGNEEGFREQRRRKRNNSSENEAPQRGNQKPTTYVDGQNQNKATRNFFAPLRAETVAEEREN
jgi:hypothetical protein